MSMATSPADVAADRCGVVRRVLPLMLALGLTAGCAAPGGSSLDADSRKDLDVSDQRMHVDLIRKMLDQQQYYAALAHVQQQQRSSGNSEDLRYLEAEARRQLGQFAAAETLYRGLLDSPLAGQAYHGLGLLFATRDINKSVQYLRESARRNPTDALARNDFGYALLRMGRYGEAMPELSTAIELDPASDRARNNLLLLLLLRRDEAGVQRVIKEAGIAPETVARLRSQAVDLQAGRTVTGVKK